MQPKTQIIAVTGAAGFIGSCLLKELNNRGIKEILTVDHLNHELKKENLKGKGFIEYFEKDEFLELVKKNSLPQQIKCLIHMGACSSTTLQDRHYFEKNNFEYSRILAEWSLHHKIRYIYASSAETYGDGSYGYKEDEATIRKCQPLNFYGESKQKFDLWVLDQKLNDQVVGLRFFNVFGPNEYHKGEMRSVIAKSYPKVISEGKISLFKSYKKEYAHGEQKRDFIYFKDAINIVLFFYDHPQISGIFNVGTGLARSWNELAKALFTAVGKKPVIEYFDMPEVLKPRYQYFTEANVNKLKQSGFDQPFSSLEDSIKDYVEYLKTQKHI